MKTPQAILIGLALIAVAILFREPSVKPANAAFGGVDRYLCVSSGNSAECGILDGDFVYFVRGSHGATINKVKWRTGKWSAIQDGIEYKSGRPFKIE